MDKTFVALDGMNRQEVFDLLSAYPQIKNVKVGLELFLRYGREFVKELSQKYQVQIFLDLKLHDIPTTVAKACKTLDGLNIRFLTVHATGGAKMLELAKESISKTVANCEILAVTILTSHNNSDIKGIWGRTHKEALINLLNEVAASGVRGIVCSGADLDIVKSFEEKASLSFTKVCPGIRPGSDHDDQVRVMTPQAAMDAGADFLVVGRPITRNPEVLRQNLFP
ncbi:orotidine 5'-phosphate decarboxylase [Bacteriovorax sp. BAL6_X]|uniref:orotidine-5'-phosphate decarboxylase n=1 Tax=Bacteriovorax sp. BAL6_X TaxID=1201290 RepID=UPI0003863638|nr:orotidine-5'-phosphate decarboxylase [Bacteriovorax sp. BAL6_X]EPZ50687.1 orotidine 5'-phosphate decarboxylase [Bacteriovorax sp. BAL6_X]